MPRCFANGARNEAALRGEAWRRKPTSRVLVHSDQGSHLGGICAQVLERALARGSAFSTNPGAVY